MRRNLDDIHVSEKSEDIQEILCWPLVPVWLYLPHRSLWLSIYNAVAFYAMDAFLKAWHNSRHDLKHGILTEIFRIHIISKSEHKMRLY
jgi:hypothetical protein